MRVSDVTTQFPDKVAIQALIDELKAYIDGIATGDIDLSNYVTKSELQAKLDTLYINIDLSSYATKEELTNAINSIDLSAYALKTEIPSLDGYAKTTDIPTVPTKVSELENDSGYLTEHQDLSDYATRTEIPSLEGYAKKNEIPVKVSELENDSGYLTEVPDLSSYALKTEIPSLDGYATKTYVDTNKFSGSYNDLTDKPTIPPAVAVKGNSESAYRTGNVNLTPENIGAVATGGNTAENTVVFTSADSTTATAWTDVSTLTTGEKHSSIFNKVSTMFKNIRFLYKMLGTTNISSIGDGTVTNAISTLNSNLDNKLGGNNLLPKGSDLNNIITNSIYVCPYGDEPYINIPVDTFKYFILITFSPTQNVALQIASSGSSSYVRRLWYGEWYDWTAL